MDIQKTFVVSLEMSKADIENYLDNAHLPKISAGKAKEFYEILCFIYNRNRNCTGQGIATAEHIAENLQIDLDTTRELCDAMVYHGITERQGGGYVI